MARGAGRGSRAGYTLMEAVVVITVMGVLISLSAPSFRHAVEQSKADVAGANLRAIWSAQRLYWLDHRAYAADLPTLEAADLVDPALVTPPSGTSPSYVYAVSASADLSTFTATATRSGDTSWSGTLTVDQTGTVSGSITGAGSSVVPAYQ